MTVFSQKGLNNIVLAIIVLLGFFIVYGLSDYINAILGAIILYTIFRQIFLNWLKKGYNKLMCTISVMLFSFMIIVVPFLALSWMVIEKIVEFRLKSTPLSEIALKFDKILYSKFRIHNAIDDAFQNIETWVINIFPTAFTGAFHIFVSLAITYFLLYFMFMYHYNFEEYLVRYLPFTRRNSERLGRELKNITYSNVLGQGIIAIVQGSLVGIGFVIFNLRDPLFWAVISTLLSFLPIIGTPMVFIPAGLIAIVNGNSFGGIGIIIYGLLLVTNIDNLMRLFINKRLADTHPIITIMGVIIGLPFFGILGLVFGPLMLSSFILLMRIYELSDHNLKKVSNNSIY